MNFVGSVFGFADSQNPKPRPLGANRKLPFHSLIASTIACIHSADGLLGFAGRSLGWLGGWLVGWSHSKAEQLIALRLVACCSSV